MNGTMNTYTQRIRFVNLVNLNKVWIVVTFFPVDLAPKIEFLLFPNQAQECNCNQVLLWLNRIHNSIYMHVCIHIFYPFSDLSVNISLYIGLN